MRKRMRLHAPLTDATYRAWQVGVSGPPLWVTERCLKAGQGWVVGDTIANEGDWILCDLVGGEPWVASDNSVRAIYEAA